MAKAQKTIQIHVSSNQGDGRVKTLNVVDGTTVAAVADKQHIDIANATVRLRRKSTNTSPKDDTVLKDGDRLTFVPAKIEGGGAAS